MAEVTPKPEYSKERTLTKPTFWSGLKVPISLDHADIPILACSVVSGLCDSSVYATWNCFVSMQTGNTVFLALGASHQPTTRPYGWLKSLTSIAFFLLGCLFFAQTRHVGPRWRRTLSFSFLIQFACIVIAAVLVQSDVVPVHAIVAGSTDRSSIQFIDLIPLAFLAFQSGGQMVTSRLLGFNEIPTTVLTSVYCDLISDPKILVPFKENVKRNRRLAAIISFLIGGICGGWLARSGPGMVVALWVAAFIKLAIAFVWTVWKVDEQLAV